MTDSRVIFDYPGGEPQRLDHFLVACLPEFSRSRLQSLIKDGLVLVGGSPAAKAGQMLERPVSVEVSIPPIKPATLEPEDIPLSIIFENQDLMVVDKPAGMVVHPAAGHSSGTLVNAALSHDPGLEGVGGVHRPGVVHRLDKDTSGLILLAKNDRAHRWLQDQFRLRKVEKIYLALVDGHPPTPAGRVEAPIGRDPRQRKQMAVVSSDKGRSATSEYRTLEVFPAYTLLEVHPVTGRTHQIRLHLAFLGCPVVGDRIYGHSSPSLPIKRHFLHAYRLTFQLPPGGDSGAAASPVTFTSPLPVELQSLLDQLRAA